MNEIIIILLMVIVILVFIEIGLLIIRNIIKSRKDEDEEDTIEGVKVNTKSIKEQSKIGKFHGVLRKEDIKTFLSFDDVQDNMIIRQNGKQFIMVLLCNGINFDLRTENEKMAIEEGFLQFLNTLRTPVQLYVQTRSLNFTDVITEYNTRVDGIRTEIEELEKKAEALKEEGDKVEYDKVRYLLNNKKNLWEYAKDAITTTEKYNLNRKVLQQKTYVVVSYFVDELGTKADGYTEEEKREIVYNELFTRCNNLANALRGSFVTARTLSSEELVELLFNAYNRDQLENINIKTYLENDHEKLYTTAEDVLEKRKRQIQQEINIAGIDLVNEAVTKADRRRKQEIIDLKLNKMQKIKEAAKQKLQQYEGVLDQDMYEEVMETIEKKETKKQ